MFRQLSRLGCYLPTQEGRYLLGVHTTGGGWLVKRSYLRWPDLLASVYPGTYFPTWMAERLSWPISLRFYDDLISITSTWYWTRIARIVAQQFTHYATAACQYERCSFFFKKNKPNMLILMFSLKANMTMKVYMTWIIMKIKHH